MKIVPERSRSAFGRLPRIALESTRSEIAFRGTEVALYHCVCNRVLITENPLSFDNEICCCFAQHSSLIPTKARVSHRTVTRSRVTNTALSKRKHTLKLSKIWLKSEQYFGDLKKSLSIRYQQFYVHWNSSTCCGANLSRETVFGVDKSVKLKIGDKN